MSTINFLLIGYICFFAIISGYVFYLDKKATRLERDLEALKK